MEKELAGYLNKIDGKWPKDKMPTCNCYDAKTEEPIEGEVYIQMKKISGKWENPKGV